VDEEEEDFAPDENDNDPDDGLSPAVRELMKKFVGLPKAHPSCSTRSLFIGQVLRSRWA
jgi:hypothetical protein